MLRMSDAIALLEDKKSAEAATAFAVIAAKRKLDTSRSWKKSFFYSAGLMEGTETVIFLVLFCLLPIILNY